MLSWIEPPYLSEKKPKFPNENSFLELMQKKFLQLS